MSAALNALLDYRQADEDGVMVVTSRQAIHEVADEASEARQWLIASLGLVEGSGPPNWDGIREFLKRTE